MSDVNVLRALADCDGRAGEPLGKAMRSAADEIERLQAELREAREAFEAIAKSARLPVTGYDYTSGDGHAACLAIARAFLAKVQP